MDSRGHGGEGTGTAAADGPGVVASPPRRVGLLLIAAVALVGLAAAVALHVINGIAQNRLSASGKVAEVEASLDGELLALYRLEQGYTTVFDYTTRVAEERNGAVAALSSVASIDSDEAARLSAMRTSLEHTIDRTAVAVQRGDGTAQLLDGELNALHGQLIGAVDTAQTHYEQDAADAGTEEAVANTLLAIGPLLLVAWLVRRTVRRDQRLAVAAVETQALRRSEESFRNLFEDSPQPMYVFDTGTLELLAGNETALRFYGYTHDEFLRRRVADLRVPEDGDPELAVRNDLQRTPREGVHVRHRTRTGDVLDVEVHARTITFQERPARLTLVVDVTARTQLENQLRHQALHDGLTGLANRVLFLDRVDHALAQRRRPGKVAVLLLDLDGFKTVNDSLGHLAGDELLADVGRRLTTSVRPGDTVARLGGDEYAILLEDVIDSDDAVHACERILAALHAPLAVDGRSVVVGASIGVAVAERGGKASGSLLREADLAMYSVKERGKGGFEVFTPTMHAVALERLSLEQDLRRALANDELYVVYQPKVETATGRIVGAEALVRWKHPTRGLVPPDRFIPLAEEIGVVTAIDDWVLRTACAQAQAWIAAGLEVQHMAVNVSGRDFEASNFGARVRRALEDTGLPPERLEIELTESRAAHQSKEMLAALHEVRSAGVRVAVDDFGTGYSMLSHLQNFPLDCLKIDKSFVDRATGAGADAPIVAAMIFMGHELRLNVVAEGVETAEQLELLRRHGCDQIQGYLFSPPVEHDAFERMLRIGRLQPVDVRDGAAVLDEALQAAADVVVLEPDPDGVARALLAELERLTGLETTFLTSVDQSAQRQEVLVVHNAGALDIREGMVTDWQDSLCRRTLIDGGAYTASVPESWPESVIGRQLGVVTFISVPVLGDSGTLVGTLCGASAQRIPMGDAAVSVMELFARLVRPRVTVGTLVR